MRWHPLEVDLLGGLETLARAPGPRFVVGPAGHETAEALVKLVAREARQYHEVERDVARRRVAALEAEVAALEAGVETDRTGAPRPLAIPGHEAAAERLARARAAAAAHEAALACPDLEAVTRAALASFEVRPRRDLEALRRRPEDGQLVELFADGYALAPDLARRLAARRELLGLPAGRDW